MSAILNNKAPAREYDQDIQTPRGTQSRITHSTEGQCNEGQRRQTGGEEERKQLEDTAELNQNNKT